MDTSDKIAAQLKEKYGIFVDPAAMAAVIRAEIAPIEHANDTMAKALMKLKGSLGMPVFIFDPKESNAMKVVNMSIEQRESALARQQAIHHAAGALSVAMGNPVVGGATMEEAVINHAVTRFTMEKSAAAQEKEWGEKQRVALAMCRDTLSACLLANSKCDLHENLTETERAVIVATWAAQEIARLRGGVALLSSAPLCGNHADSWYCERNHILEGKEDACLWCELAKTAEEAKAQAERERGRVIYLRRDANQQIVEFFRFKDAKVFPCEELTVTGVSALHGRIKILEMHIGAMVKYFRDMYAAQRDERNARLTQQHALEALRESANHADMEVPHKVYFGCIGCLTDDCEFWQNGTCKEGMLCKIGLVTAPHTKI